MPFTTNLLFILRACSKLLYVYKPIGPVATRSDLLLKIETNEYAKRSRKPLPLYVLL